MMEFSPSTGRDNGAVMSAVMAALMASCSAGHRVRRQSRLSARGAKAEP
jgi:hypothetical protein